MPFDPDEPLGANGGVKHHDGGDMEKHSTVGDLKESPESDRRDASTTCWAAPDSKPSALEEFETAMNGSPEERADMIRRLDEAAKRNPAAWKKLEAWVVDADRLATKLGLQ